MAYWPVNIDLAGRTCLVAGGGEVGLRKVRGLLEAGAVVKVCGRELSPELKKMAEDGRIAYLGPEYMPEYLDDAALVFAATSDAVLNRRIGEEAVSRGIWVNVADCPNLCTFIVPASIRRGDLVIAVSTGGASPALSRRLRIRLEEEFGPEYGRFIEILRAVRQKVLSEGRPSGANRDLFRRLVDSPLLDLLAGDDPAGVDAVLQNILGLEYSLKSLGMDVTREDG